VDTSSIPLAGRGLFAAATIRRNDYIGEYIGELVEDAEYVERAFTDERMTRVALSKCP
jgi:SET domain-containing protein